MTIIRFAAALIGTTIAASCAEAVAPDVCRDGVCLTGVRWKKGTLEHTLVGVIKPEAAGAKIESVIISMEYSDPKKHGSGVLRLKDINGPMPFYFKVHHMSVKWTESKFELTANAITGIEPLERDGIICRFKSLGSRLSASIENGGTKDIVLDYQLLTLTHSGENLRLNGTHGKYTDLATPNPPTLISSKSRVAEEFIPVGSAVFTDGDWVEDWRMHHAITGDSPTLALSLKIDGQAQIEKLPLAVQSTRISVSGAVAVAGPR